MKPNLQLIQGGKSAEEHDIVAAIKPLGNDAVPSPLFLKQTRLRILSLTKEGRTSPRAA